MSETIVLGLETSRWASELVARVSVLSSVWNGKVSGNSIKVMECTLKTRRILFRSNLQLAIASSSSFLWRRREIAFRFSRLATFLWISATVLLLRIL